MWSLSRITILYKYRAVKYIQTDYDILLSFVPMNDPIELLQIFPAFLKSRLYYSTMRTIYLQDHLRCKAETYLFHIVRM